MKKSIVAVVGGAGRMGAELYQCLKEHSEFDPAVAVDRNPAPLYVKSVAELDELYPNEIDALIDFSLPELTLSTLRWVKEHKKPVVVGTTGIGSEHHQLIEEIGQSSPILWSPNMSFGIALLGEAMKLLAQASPGFDYHITDFHHRHKKDNPSGTALFLKEKLETALGGEKIPEPTGVRGGGIFGVHQVFAMSEEEVLCFEHQALNRRVFAKGAVRALSWLRQQDPGCYSLADVLKGKRV